ncbi:MAG: hypothetical protein GF383_01815 [Candidatus Lokiarchaeota archaeon]|nr:hypothetical protein [Candidatus Lokiarchaeota archaeon]MBD3338081.1 hypothetical protein [Candidatus Lokiarchaeota archaeon]
MYKKILVAIDQSEDSQRVIKQVIDIQKIFNSKVVVFHSIDTKVSFPMNIPLVSTQTGHMSAVVTPRKLEIERRRSAKKLLENAKELFRKNFLSVETRLIEDFEPEDYITNAIEEENFDLIVVGCKGDHSKLRRVFMDTIPNKVLNQAAADLLIVR